QRRRPDRPRAEIAAGTAAANRDQVVASRAKGRREPALPASRHRQRDSLPLSPFSDGIPDAHGSHESNDVQRRERRPVPSQPRAAEDRRRLLLWLTVVSVAVLLGAAAR